MKDKTFTDAQRKRECTLHPIISSLPSAGQGARLGPKSGGFSFSAQFSAARPKVASWVPACLFLTCMLVLIAAPGLAKVVTKDKNGDGRIDIRAHFEHGDLTLLEADSTADGVFDRRQIYEHGDLVRVERDTNDDGTWETVDTYRQGKRVKQVIKTPDGDVQQLIRCDARGRLHKVRRDTNGDQILDTVFAYRQGELCNATRDMDANGVWESLQLFAKGTLREMRTDADQDKVAEQIVHYSGQKNPVPVESEHDTDRDGFRETFRFYDHSNLHREKVISPQDGSVRTITLFADGKPCKRRQDTTGDGHLDTITWFENDQPAKQEKDTNGDGSKDTVTLFNARGEVEEVKKDTNYDGYPDRIMFMANDQVQRVELDADHDRFFETRIHMRDGLRRRMSKDEDQDGKAEMVVDYDRHGERIKLSADKNGDNRMDTWQSSSGGRLTKLERDTNGNGQRDLKVLYREGKKDRLLRDQDGDGRFEIVQRYNVQGWDMVLTQDQNGDHHPEVTLSYQKGLLRQKKVFDAQGRVQFIDFFDDQGRLCKSREREGRGLSLTWIYDHQGRAVQARRDKDLDGTPDVFFFYQNGTLRKVTEDTNGDGQVDVWETYDQSEALISRKRDLDFDGRPDLTKAEGSGRENNATATN